VTGLIIFLAVIAGLIVVGALIVLTDNALRYRSEREADELWSRVLAEVKADVREDPQDPPREAGRRR
jgi:hypothetical protein